MKVAASDDFHFATADAFFFDNEDTPAYNRDSPGNMDIWRNAKLDDSKRNPFDGMLV
jgi:hypothetical protein